MDADMDNKQQTYKELSREIEVMKGEQNEVWRKIVVVVKNDLCLFILRCAFVCVEQYIGVGLLGFLRDPYICSIVRVLYQELCSHLFSYKNCSLPSFFGFLPDVKCEQWPNEIHVGTGAQVLRADSKACVGLVKAAGYYWNYCW